MELLLLRHTPPFKFPELAMSRTIGTLYVNGQIECYTLEDVDRGDNLADKIKGETAIPCGRYRVIITDSPKFKRPLPEILAVQGYSGVRIHPLNTEKETEGCIGVGRIARIDRIEESKLAFDSIFWKISIALKTEEVWITVDRMRH